VPLDAWFHRVARRLQGPSELLSCSFCGKHQKQVKKLIAGPGVYICDECVERVHGVLTSSAGTASTPFAAIAQVSDADVTLQCTFCGKRRQQVAAMASTGHAHICTECLDLCNEIISEELAGGSAQQTEI